MPATRRLRLLVLIVALFILITFYVSTGRRSTYSSQFYSRTVAAIGERKGAEAKAGVLAEEKVRQERVARLQEEHDIAVGKSSEAEEKKRSPSAGIANKKGGAKDEKDSRAVGPKEDEGQIPVAGRKMMKDGRVVVNDKGDGNDGVAKLGNVPLAKTMALEGESSNAETDLGRKVETEMNSILKKGPIIIFSKSFCPFSKKAKNILLNFYDITPPPYVVELDTHPLGPLLQTQLGKTTGRVTVPNVLVNGKSIGGGDDMERLHLDDRLISTIQSLGGKRITEIKPAKVEAVAPKKEPRKRSS